MVRIVKKILCTTRIRSEGWKDVRIELPPDAGAAPLRIDFVSALTTIEIASIRLTKGTVLYSAASKQDFESIDVRGDAERLPDGNVLRFRNPPASIRNFFCR